MSVIAAQGISKSFGDVRALDGFDLHVQKGHIVGLIGPNGSGKTTALKAMLGLSDIDGGSLTVLDKNPMRERASLMQDIAYIADTGILPKWMRVRDLLTYVASIHPRFDLSVAQAQLAATDIQLNKKIQVLSKGMHVQLHLAIVLAIGAELLVLDEPTLGLDIIYRQKFYDGVLNGYFNEGRSILVTTHEVREIEHILTDVVFIHKGRARLSIAMDDLAEQFVKLTCAEHDEVPPGALGLRQTLAGQERIYKGVAASELSHYGEVATPNLAELFIAIVEAEDA